MLILICKVIGFFQGILKGKKSEFNYHYSKKHHGTERLRLAHVCFTPLSKMWAGGVGRGGDAGCTPLPPAPPAPPPQRPGTPASPGHHRAPFGLDFTPKPSPWHPHGGSSWRRELRRGRILPGAGLGQEQGLGGAVSAQARPGFGRVFFHPVALFLPKWIFGSNCLFFFFLLRENIISNYISLGFH